MRQRVAQAHRGRGARSAAAARGRGERGAAAALAVDPRAAISLFVGYRHYRLKRGASARRLVPEPRTSLGILPRARTPSLALRGQLRALDANGSS